MTANVLVVDDVGEYGQVFEMYFPENCKLLLATSVEEAQAIFNKQNSIDLAIIDVRLNENVKSDTSGMELLSWVRKKYPSTQVVMISAYQSFEYEMEAMERGAYRFIRKPLQPELVKKTLKEVISQ